MYHMPVSYTFCKWRIMLLYFYHILFILKRCIKFEFKLHKKILQKNFCIAGKGFAVKVLREMNGDSTFYNLFGSGVSCLRIKRLSNLEIEFRTCEILSTFM